MNEKKEKKDDALRYLIVVIWTRRPLISGYNRPLFVCFALKSAL
jgi:hypothetical protein